ncbi:MAG: imidazole glycerol phosphate synthase subunit HisH [bacterium]|nr:imidazole glycerol phosphate synthase subunit HisH [bacterium]
MNIIVDYDAGNITSLCNALEKLKTSFQVSDDESVIRKADKVFFPGQGHMAQARRSLEKKGLIDCIRSLTQPFLGICVGMQLLYDWSEEGETEGLGIVSGKLMRFSDPDLKVPQMGWNSVTARNDNPLFRGLNEEYFYFVHSYAAPLGDQSIAKAEYGGPFTAACQHKNFSGVQFHPEKSGEAGLQLLKNFLAL